jgi:hypothetical protein
LPPAEKCLLVFDGTNDEARTTPVLVKACLRNYCSVWRVLIGSGGGERVFHFFKNLISRESEKPNKQINSPSFDSVGIEKKNSILKYGVTIGIVAVVLKRDQLGRPGNKLHPYIPNKIKLSSFRKQQVAIADMKINKHLRWINYPID